MMAKPQYGLILSVFYAETAILMALNNASDDEELEGRSRIAPQRLGFLFV